MTTSAAAGRPRRPSCARGRRPGGPRPGSSAASRSACARLARVEAGAVHLARERQQRHERPRAPARHQGVEVEVQAIEPVGAALGLGERLVGASGALGELGLERLGARAPVDVRVACSEVLRDSGRLAHEDPPAQGERRRRRCRRERRATASRPATVVAVGADGSTSAWRIWVRIAPIGFITARRCRSGFGIVVDHVDHRRRVEEELQRHLPDRLHVAEADVQRRQQHRHAGREHHHHPDQQRQLEPVDARLDRRRRTTKTNTATMFSPRLNSECSATASGITSRGKRILRSRLSRSTSDVTPRLVVSAK